MFTNIQVSRRTHTQFAVNARCSPGRILGNHTENQGADLFADTRPSSYLTDSGDPRPIQTKPRSMPVHDGSRSDQDERLGPSGPERSQRNPEQLLQWQLIDGEVVARAEPAIADGEPGSQRRGPRGSGKR